MTLMSDEPISPALLFAKFFAFAIFVHGYSQLYCIGNNKLPNRGQFHTTFTSVIYYFFESVDGSVSLKCNHSNESY